MILIQGGHVYAPHDLGVCDVLIGDERILLIKPAIHLPPDFLAQTKVIDARDTMVTPGFIDNHVHVIGGGGEAGFSSRVPEVRVSDFIQNGITSCIGLLGTDGLTRHPKDVYAKVKALNLEGISAWMHTGSYGFPSVTITGRVADDVTFVDAVIGVKVALSDHRSSMVTRDELLRLASEARVAGMISGKAGVVLAHMGDGEEGLRLVLDIVQHTPLPKTTIIPTHVNRKPALLQQAFEYAKMGGYIDLTAFEGKASAVLALEEAKRHRVPLSQVLISSDGNGSTSTYDAQGRLLSLGVLGIDKLLTTFQSLVSKQIVTIEEALSLMSLNVAIAFALPRKGKLDVGFDGDVLIWGEKLHLETVIAKGQVMMEDGQILKKGVFE